MDSTNTASVDAPDKLSPTPFSPCANMPDQERVADAIDSLVSKVVPAYPDDDEESYEERLNDAFDYAITKIDQAGETPLSPDANHAHDLIKKKLVRQNIGPEKAVRFANLYSRLLTMPVLSNKWAMLWFLFLLSEPHKIDLSGLREIDPSVLNRVAGGSSETLENLRDMAGSRESGIDGHPSFDEAFSTAGLQKMPPAESQRPPRPLRENRSDRRIPERPRSQAQAQEEAEAEQTAEKAPETQREYPPMSPSESTLLRDLPFTLQGLSSTKFPFKSNQILRLPKTLSVPIVSLLHTLAEPALLYKGLSEFVETSDGGLIGQSLRSALGLELRSYLRLVATLEGQIRSALAKLDDNEPHKNIGKAGVTLKRCVVWTREPTMGLRLLSLIMEESKGTVEHIWASADTNNDQVEKAASSSLSYIPFLSPMATHSSLHSRNDYSRM